MALGLSTKRLWPPKVSRAATLPPERRGQVKKVVKRLGATINEKEAKSSGPNIWGLFLLGTLLMKWQTVLKDCVVKSVRGQSMIRRCGTNGGKHDKELKITKKYLQAMILKYAKWSNNEAWCTYEIPPKSTREFDQMCKRPKMQQERKYSDGNTRMDWNWKTCDRSPLRCVTREEVDSNPRNEVWCHAQKNAKNKTQYRAR